jgi:hypothetical protein
MSRRRLRVVSGKKASTWIVVALYLAGLIGCTSAPEGGGGVEKASKRSTPVSGIIPAEKVEACAGFTPQTAAFLLGVSAAGIVDQSRDIYDKLRSCIFVDPEDPLSGLAFSLRRDDSVEEAAAEMATFREHLGVARQVFHGAEGSTEGAAVEEIPGLGDEAVWTRVNGTLDVRFGNIMIQVSRPEDRATQKRVAALALVRLVGRSAAHALTPRVPGPESSIAQRSPRQNAEEGAGALPGGPFTRGCSE